ncbi:hypothetical protein DXG03_001917, partial [Asterophora parasitica]
MSGSRASPSASSAVVALLGSQVDQSEWQPVLHVSNQVEHTLAHNCPYCKQVLPSGFEPDLVHQEDYEDFDRLDSYDADPAYHSRASDYFQLLAIANETSSRPSTPPPLAQEQKSAFPAEKMAEGYFKAFFQEEYKLGMGANGSVYLCQHMLDGNPLGHFAVKKIAVGESHSYLLKILREVRLLERLHHPNIITYHHAWLESCQFSAFGPKVPTLHVLMQWAEGGSLDDFIDVRLGRAAQHVHIDPLAQFSFEVTSHSHISDPSDPNGPVFSIPLAHDHELPLGDPQSRSARIRAFRQFQHASPAERERIKRDMDVARERGRGKTTSLMAVHLLSAVEVKGLFSDVVGGLEFLHNKSILHLDLKPGNVLLTWDEGKLIPRAMLSDFGTSRDMLHSTRNRSGNTGTLEYTSPESLPSPLTGLLQSIDSKADMWSLGMILHKLLFFRLPYRYAAEGDGIGEPVSTDREGEKLERLEREVLAYPGFKSTSGLVTTFEARRLPRSFLVLLESLLNPTPSTRPSCERVVNAIKDGKLDPLKDDFLRSSTAISAAVGPVTLRRSDPGRVGFDPFTQNTTFASTNSSEGEERSPSVEPVTASGDEGDGQATPRASPVLIPVKLSETTQLLGPPSPPPASLTNGPVSALHTLERRIGLGPLPRGLWKRALKSCVLVAK